ncbi:unnamed protein product [Heterobilharzia americana]|nr:unnamed protein product [Heterobilharzia americana]
MERCLTFNLTHFMHSLQKAVEKCSEYDLIPHLDGEDHQYLIVSGSAFAICKCTSTVIFSKYKSAAEPIAYDLVNSLLLLAPNTTTFWNYKRTALLNHEVSINSEMKFTQLILSKFPRSNETIFHRQWIIENFNYIENYDFLLYELKVCNKIADKYRCHYGLWQYRRFILHQLKPKNYTIELNHMDDWLSQHPTDVSGWSYLASILEGLVNHCVVEPSSSSTVSLLSSDNQLQWKDVKEILQNYFNKMHNILELYPERECVWMFRRQLITLWLRLNSFGTDHNHNIDVLLSEVEPLLPRIHDILIKLKVSNQLLKGLSFNEFLNWSYKNDICCKESSSSSLKWIDLLYLRYLFWLSEYVSEMISFQSVLPK